MDANSRLQEAIESADLRRVKAALAKGADPNLKVAPDGRGMLRCAVAGGNKAIVEALLAAGAKVMERGNSTALHAAAARGDVAMVKLLLSDGRAALFKFDSEER